jgi:hypothetical protein
MTVFPSVAPTARVWTPGVRAQSVYQSIDGREIRFAHGTRVVGQRLSLGFDNVLEATGKLITDHYADVETTFESFTLPAEVFAGMASYAYTNSASNEWRYASPPQVTYVSPGIQSVTVELLGVSA